MHINCAKFVSLHENILIMPDKFVFSTAEKEEAMELYTRLREQLSGALRPDDEEKIRTHILHSIELQQVRRDAFGLNPILTGLQTALIVVDEIGLRRDAVLATLLHTSYEDAYTSSTIRTPSSRATISATSCCRLPRICVSSSS